MKKQINSACAVAFSSQVLMSRTEASCVIHPGLVVSSNFSRCGQFLTVAIWPEAVYLTSRHPCVNGMSLNISGADRVSGSYQRQDTRDRDTSKRGHVTTGDMRASWQSYLIRSMSPRTQMEHRKK